MGCGDDEYECTLSPELQLLAQKELREDDTTRSQALSQIRNWIDMHPDIHNCRKDAAFLLRFLRTKKFCVPIAQELLEKYLTIRQLYPHWFQNLDVLEPEIQDVLDSGYIIALPERDSEGRKVLFTCACKFDPYKHSSEVMARVHSIVIESLMDDEENQIRGYTQINDESGITMAHVSMWTISDIRCMIRCIQNSTPMRHKTSHFVNVPPYASKMFDFFTTLLSDKMKNRVMLHKDIESLQSSVDSKILPKEYGGKVPMADMIVEFKKFLESKRDLVMALDKMKIEVNKKAKFVTELEEHQITGMAGSFRKLQVD